MKRREAEAALSQRPFIKVYWDFIESDVLENVYQKVVYLFLKLLAFKGVCSPSIQKLSKLTKICANKVRSVLHELERMGLITRTERKKENGLFMPNEYQIINDTPETWGAENRPDGKRLFTKVYKDTLESGLFNDCYEMWAYICLSKFADKDMQCWPSIRKIAETAGIGVSKVKQCIVALKKKGLITKENRWDKKGRRASNLYTLLLNHFKKKKGSANQPKEQNQSNTINSYNVTSSSDECQEKSTAEGSAGSTDKYQKEWIHKYFNLDNILLEHPTLSYEVNAVLEILYENLNTTKAVVVVSGEKKQKQVVVGALMKLHEDSILWSIERFCSQRDKIIRNPKQYMLSVLYDAATGGFDLALRNQVNFDLANNPA